MNKYKNEIIDFVFTIGIILILFLTILFVNIYIVDNFEGFITKLIIHIIVIVSMCYLCKILKIKFQYSFLLIVGYIIYNIYFLFLGFKDNKKKNTNILIQKKSIFQSKEQKYKYNYGTIEEKIIILRDMNLSKKQIYKKLENDMKFRELMKDGNKEVEMILK